MLLMNAFTCFLLLILSSMVIGDENTSTENNEVIPKESVRKIEDKVRQALIRAIDKLEKQAAQSHSSEEDSANNQDDEEPEVPARVVEISTTTTSVPEEILEESTTSDDVAPTVQFFTAAFDEKLSKEQPLISFIRKEKQLKNKILASVNQGSPDALNGTASISPDKLQATRSIASDRTNEISSESKGEIQFQITKVKKKPVPTTTKTTTTTTTTTPRPTHNEDGENIELVSKDDIKIQAAPLVTAFTVDLDERGAAKNVIPIIDRYSTTKKPEVASRLGATIARLNVLPVGAVLPTSLTSQNAVLQPKVNSAVTADNQLPGSDTKLQQSSGFPLADNYLIERQRTLEQQIYQLQLQAKQQQEQIRRQLQILEQQQQNQNQQQQQLPTQEFALPIQSTSNKNQQGSNSGFTIRPSIEFIPNASNTPDSFGFASSQQLPFTKPSQFNSNSNRNQFNSNEFLNTNNNAFGASSNGNQVFLGNPNPNVFELNGAQQQSFVQIQPSNQLPFVPNLSETLVQQPPELSLFQSLPQNNYQVFRNLPFLNGPNNFLQQQQENQQQQHRTRQFRQESQTGNLALNQLSSSQNQNFYRQQLLSANSNQLQNVAAAYQSGIRFDHTPELNIISKVLALNHGINPYAQENLRYQAGQSGF